MRPVAVAIMGLPGAGKTVVAAELQRRVAGMRRVSRDELRAELLERPDYGDAEKRMLLGAVLERTERHLASGRDVVLDGLTFSRRAERDALAAAAAKHGAAAVFALLELPLDVARRRVAGAQHAAADRTPALVADVAARFEPVAAGTLVLDATRPVEETAARLAAAVDAAR